MNNGILAPQPFSSAVSMMDSTMEPLLGNAQPTPVPYHYPQSYDFRIGNNDGISGKDFVFVVDTTILGSTTISILCRGDLGDRFSIDWGDGTYGAIAPVGTQRTRSFETVLTFTSFVSTPIIHTYTKHGIYTIILRGRFSVDSIGSSESLTAILSYGDTNYRSTTLYHGTDTNLVYVPPQIPTSVTDLTSCFISLTKFNHPNIALWDVSRIQNMVGLFSENRGFNQDLDKWKDKVGNVNDFTYAFFNSSFNGSLSGWVLGDVDCSLMFGNCNSFVGKGLNNWDVTGVQNVNSMFTDCASLNVNLSGWNLCNCYDMSNFMSNTNIGSDNYDILLNSWELSSTGNPIKPWETSINVDFGSAKYTTASSGARQRLVDYGWTITDGGFQA